MQNDDQGGCMCMQAANSVYIANIMPGLGYANEPF